MVLCWLLCLPTGAPQDAAPISERVGTLLAKHLGDLDGAQRQRYANELIAALATASPHQSSLILSNLDQAIGYHASKMDWIREQYRDVPLPEELVQEGYTLEVQYLTQRVLRAARNEWTPEARQAVVGQIESLALQVQSALEPRIGGEAGKGYVDREVDKMRKAWIGSLELPLNRFLDGPVPADSLEAVKQGIAAKVSGFSPVELTQADLAGRERLAELGILKLVADARQEAFKATQFCFAEFQSPEGRCNDWESKVEAQFGDRRKKAVREEYKRLKAEGLPKAGAPRPGRSADSPPAAARRAPNPSLRPDPPGGSGVAQVRSQDRSSPDRVKAALLALGVGVTLLVCWLVGRWLKGKSSGGGRETPG